VGGHRFDNETVATLSSSLQSTQSFMSAALIHRHKYICQFEGIITRVLFVSDAVTFLHRSRPSISSRNESDFDSGPPMQRSVIAEESY